MVELVGWGLGIVVLLLMVVRSGRFVWVFLLVCWLVLFALLLVVWVLLCVAFDLRDCLCG